MNRLEKIAIHVLLFCIFAAGLLNIILAFGGTVQRWDLPVAYVLYAGGMLAYRAYKKRAITWRHIALLVAAPLAVLLVAIGLSHAYDTSWDGQDYQQSAIIALAHGWNPWHHADLPIHIPVSQEYVVGYPKTTWLLQASVYKLTGRIQSAPITNVVVAFVAAVLVYGVLRRLKLSKKWCGIVTFLAVAEIHFLQQLPTFMADGYSYQLGLIAIASFCLLVLEKRKTWPLIAFAASWLLLVGGKFSNLFVCATLIAVLAVYMWRSKLYLQKHVQFIVASTALVALLLLWVPFGTNTLRFHSPVYPQNQASESGKLRFDNVPNNLKKANRVELLFYGVFSSTEPSDAGNPTSAQNVAQLKWPFTFRHYEIHEVNNFQGRVGSGGFLFSGIVVLAIVAGIALAIYRPKFALPGLGLSTTVLAGLIVLAALFIPVPNKLRYSPLITLLPLLVVVLLASVKGAKRWPRISAIVLVIFISANTFVSAGSMIATRISDAHTINTQLTSLQKAGGVYHVHAASFYANYTRMQEHGINVVIDQNLTCSQPQTLQFSYDTTQFCHTKS